MVRIEPYPTLRNQQRTQGGAHKAPPLCLAFPLPLQASPSVPSGLSVRPFKPLLPFRQASPPVPPASPPLPRGRVAPSAPPVIPPRPPWRGLAPEDPPFGQAAFGETAWAGIGAGQGRREAALAHGAASY